jgi:hypothetical protein
MQKLARRKEAEGSWEVRWCAADLKQMTSRDRVSAGRTAGCYLAVSFGFCGRWRLLFGTVLFSTGVCGV